MGIARRLLAHMNNQARVVCHQGDTFAPAELANGNIGHACAFRPWRIGDQSFRDLPREDVPESPIGLRSPSMQQTFRRRHSPGTRGNSMIPRCHLGKSRTLPMILWWTRDDGAYFLGYARDRVRLCSRSAASGLPGERPAMSHRSSRRCPSIPPLGSRRRHHAEADHPHAEPW